MKLTLICGRLEPGQDGVGDYSRRLAGAAHDRGHQVQLLSISDDVDQDELIADDFRVQRFSGLLSRGDHFERIISTIQAWAPEAVSLQFVPFSYQPKGLINHLIPLIESLRVNRLLQVMMHETWVRWDPGAKWKHRILGQMQRLLILKALKIWAPEVIHTSNSYYRNLLAKNGIDSSILPLFGNIPVCDCISPDALEAILGIQPLPDELRLVFPFNQEHNWKPLEFLSCIKPILDRSGKPIRLIQAGRTHGEYGHWEAIQKFASNAGWACHLLGPCSTETLSTLLQNCHIGISASQIQLARKSGAVLAMLEHGLPVLCSQESKLLNRAAYTEKRLTTYEMDDSKLSELLLNSKRELPNSKIDSTVIQWLSSLEN